ncbi:MAG: lipopolysaccharide core heptose(II) kinase RfaY [Fusobacteriaceae bacterium]
MKRRVLDSETEIFYQKENSQELIEKIKNRSYREIKKFKDDQRSKVSLIEIGDNQYVYKEPIEKNRKSWQRFSSIFRGGESKREFLNCEKIKKIGFSGPEPILALEKKRFLMTVDSFFVMEYIEGKHAGIEDLDLVMKNLKTIHGKGYLHGDSQLSNFMVRDNVIYLIDCKLSRNIFGIIGKIWEFIYLEESCYREIKSGYEKKMLYKILKKLGEKIDDFNYARKALRKKLKGD